MTQVEYHSRALAPLWKFYEAAKAALAEVEALPTNAENVDWSYVNRQKQQFRREIAEFEQRFPNYRRQDYLESALVQTQER
jgi:hypothetical protein